MGICQHSSHSKTPRWLAKARLDRRTILKAAAAFGATSAYAMSPSLRPRVHAQGVPTLAQEWSQPEGVGGESGALGFETEFPFYAIAPHWPSDSGTATAIEVSTSRDGIAWSSPALLGAATTDAGPTDKDDRIYGQLAFTDESNYVRYRALDTDGNEQSVPGLTFTYIDATGGPGLGDISTASPVPSLQRPPIISREEWGANLTYGGAERGGSEWLPEYQTVEHVIIHHSETSNFRDPLTEIRSIHYYHAITRGWGDIGYNYLVDFMGNVYEGRVGGDNVVGGHAYQYAHGSSGVCVMGSFSVATATPEMLAGLTWITAWAARYLDPLAKADFHETPNLPTICGHRDVNDSSCPGDGMYADLDYIREAVAEVLAGALETIPDPDYSPGEVIAVAADYANLRSLPGTSEAIIASPGYGSVFQVIEGPTTVDNQQWYRVRGDAGTGWIAQSTFAASTAAAPAGDYAIGDTVYVREDLVNLRSEPSLRGSIVGSVDYMVEAEIVDGPMPANGYTWYQVQASGLTGWLAERYVGFEDDLAKPARLGVGDSVVTVEPEGISLRVNPSTEATRLLGLPEGTKGTVIDGPTNARGYNWIKVQTALGTGWAAEEYFDLTTASTSDVAKFAVGDDVVVDTDFLNMREQPTTSARIVATLGTGIGATVLAGPDIALNMAWYKIESSEGTGWSVSQYLAKTGGGSSSRAFTIGDAVYTNDGDVNLRSSASTGADVLDTLEQGETGSVVDGPTTANGHTWYRVQLSRNTGWIAAEYLGKGAADPAASGFGKGALVTTADGDAVNVRSSASIGASILGQIESGETATIAGSSTQADGYEWVKVDLDGSTGWCVKDLLTLMKNGGKVKGATVRVIDGELNLRASGSTAAEIVAVLPDSTYAEILSGPEEADGYDWYRVSTSRYGSGWAAGDYLQTT